MQQLNNSKSVVLYYNVTRSFYTETELRQNRLGKLIILLLVSHKCMETLVKGGEYL